MAISSKNLARILAPNFVTGSPDKAKEVKSDAKKVGVLQTKSAFDKADQRSSLNVAKYQRKRVVAITPFMAEDYANASKMKRYAERALRDCITRTEAPIMSHLFYYEMLNTNDAIERDMGLHSQLAWIPKADLVVVYVDFGITAAMQVAINVAETKGRKIEYRSIGGVA